MVRGVWPALARRQALSVSPLLWQADSTRSLAEHKTKLPAPKIAGAVVRRRRVLHRVLRVTWPPPIRLASCGRASPWSLSPSMGGAGASIAAVMRCDGPSAGPALSGSYHGARFADQVGACQPTPRPITGPSLIVYRRQGHRRGHRDQHQRPSPEIWPCLGGDLKKRRRSSETVCHFVVRHVKHGCGPSRRGRLGVLGSDRTAATVRWRFVQTQRMGLGLPSLRAELGNQSSDSLGLAAGIPPSVPCGATRRGETP